MAATPSSPLYNHRVHFESQIEGEQSMSTRGQTGNSCVGELCSSKEQCVSENANTIAAYPSELGGSMPHMTFDVDESDYDIFISSSLAFECSSPPLQYPMDDTPPSLLYDPWVDFDSQLEATLEEESMSTAMGSSRHLSIEDVWSSKNQKMVADANRNRTSNEYAVENSNTLAADPHEQRGSMPHVPIDVDALDDSALVSSSMAVAGVISNSPLNRERAIIIDLESEQTVGTSTMGSLGHPFIGDVWSSKKRKMVGDANRDRESTEYANTLAADPREQGESVTHVPIDVDALDDNALVASSMTFPCATNNSQLNPERVAIIDVESEEQTKKRKMVVDANRNRVSSEGIMEIANTPAANLREQGESSPNMPVDFEAYFDDVTFVSSLLALGNQENAENVQPPALLPPPPPEEPIYSCPICMASLDEATTTRCGHIFCKKCLKAALTFKKECPTCRKKIATMRGTLRVYLPTTR